MKFGDRCADDAGGFVVAPASGKVGERTVALGPLEQKGVIFLTQDFGGTFAVPIGHQHAAELFLGVQGHLQHGALFAMPNR